MKPNTVQKLALKKEYNLKVIAQLTESLKGGLDTALIVPTKSEIRLRKDINDLIDILLSE